MLNIIKWDFIKGIKRYKYFFTYLLVLYSIMGVMTCLPDSKVREFFFMNFAVVLFLLPCGFIGIILPILNMVGDFYSQQRYLLKSALVHGNKYINGYTLITAKLITNTVYIVLGSLIELSGEMISKISGYTFISTNGGIITFIFVFVASFGVYIPVHVLFAYLLSRKLNLNGVKAVLATIFFAVLVILILIGMFHLSDLGNPYGTIFKVAAILIVVFVMDITMRMADNTFEV